MPEHLASERPGKEGQALVNNREEESPRTGTLSSHGAASLARKFSTAPACSLGTSDPPLSPSTPPEQTHSLSEVQGPSRIGGGSKACPSTTCVLQRGDFDGVPVSLWGCFPTFKVDNRHLVITIPTSHQAGGCRLQTSLAGLASDPSPSHTRWCTQQTLLTSLFPQPESGLTVPVTLEGHREA